MDELKLIREIEKTIAFKKFHVSKRSSKDELIEVLQFIATASNELQETFMPQINEFLKDRE